MVLRMQEPEEPTDDDCCHNGCNPCVFDIYEQKKKLWMENKLNDSGNSQFRYDLLSETCFKPFKLISIKPLTNNTNLCSFQSISENLKGLLPIKPGQHLVLRSSSSFKDKNDEFLLTRSYSIIPGDGVQSDCGFDVAIKLYEDGPMSKYIKTLLPGDVTYWRGPYGNFSYETNKYSHITMICMGTGIAPMYSLSKSIVMNDLEETVITLLYGCRNSKEIILRDQLLQLMSFWNFSCTYFLSEDLELENKKRLENFVNGRISSEQIKQKTKFREKEFYLVCGKDNFCNQMKNILLNDFNVPENKILIF